MCLKKPISMEFVKYLWQHVLKHRIKITNGAKISNNNNNNNTEGNIGENGSMSESLSDDDDEDDDDQNHSMSDVEINGPINQKKKKKKDKNGKRKGRRYQEVSEMNSNDTKSSGHVKKKACTEWTRELHAKFMDAVTKLGEGSMSLFFPSFFISLTLYDLTQLCDIIE